MFLVLESGLLWVTVLLLFIIGLLVLYKDPKSTINRSFSLLTISLLFWIVASFFEDEVKSDFLRKVFLDADFSFAAFSIYTFLLFCTDIVHLKIATKIWFRFLIFLIPLILSVLIFTTHIIVAGYEITSTGVLNPILGSGGVIYDIFLSVAALLGGILIFWNYKKVDSLEKTRYIYLIIGLVLSASIALVTNVFITSYIENSPNYQFYSRLGIYGSIFVALLPGYAIIRYRLFNIKIITTEILSFIILLVMFVQVFLSESWFQLVTRIITFAILFFLVIVLVKSVGEEVKRKEELQKISDALAIANQRLKELDATKSEFISIASHQLRTPLTAIKGYISLLLEGSYGVVSPQVLDILNKLYSVNNRLVHLVEDLLNVSRIEAGRIQYSFAPTQLEPIIVELVDMFKPTAKDKKLTLEMKLLKNPLPLLTIDPNKIKEVLSNLIDNSLKYTVQGGVTVSLESTPSVVCIIVSDTGIGIKPEDKGKLFEKFIRTSETTKMVASGAGLGLYVGKSFIEAHGGKIWAESDGPDKGSRFIIELPFKNPKIKVGTSDQPSHSGKA